MNLENLIIGVVNNGFGVTFKMTAKYDCFCEICPETQKAFHHLDYEEGGKGLIGYSSACSTFEKAFNNAMGKMRWKNGSGPGGS